MKPISHYYQLNRWRRIFQLGSIAFMIAVPLLNLYGIHWIYGNFYSMTIAGLTISDPLMALQTLIIGVVFQATLLFSILIPVLIAMIFGRVFCSWICPHNTLAETIHTCASRLIPNSRFKRYPKPGDLKARNPNALSTWIIGAFWVVILYLMGFPLFLYLSPPGMLSNQISLFIFEHRLGFELTLVGSILLLEGITMTRFFCSRICPVGLCLGLFKTPRSMAVHFEPQGCGCNQSRDQGFEPCFQACPLNLAPKKRNLYPHCHHCGLCLKACESTGHQALQFRFKNPD